MRKKESDLQKACMRAEAALGKTNKKIEKLGSCSSLLYEELGRLQQLFGGIRNVPEEKLLEFENTKKIRLDWKKQAEKIEADYLAAKIKQAGNGIAGAGAGIALATLGPTAAMGIATSFGVASTGTAISTLSGAAAANAALAWLGGGALAAGGGGIAAGNALLMLAGPAGWAISGITLFGSGILFLKTRNSQKKIENIFTLISIRDEKSYDLAVVELNERIGRIENETKLLGEAVSRIISFGSDYGVMTEAQQYELGSYVNLMQASIQLLVNPILGLQPKYLDIDFDECRRSEVINVDKKAKPLVVYLCNLLYKINFDNTDRKLLRKVLRKNKELLSSMGLKKGDFDRSILESVALALKRKAEN